MSKRGTQYLSALVLSAAAHVVRKTLLIFTEIRSLGTVEDQTSEVQGTEKTWGGCVCGGKNSGERAWSVETQPDTGVELRTVKCLLVASLDYRH